MRAKRAHLLQAPAFLEIRLRAMMAVTYPCRMQITSTLKANRNALRPISAVNVLAATWTASESANWGFTYFATKYSNWDSGTWSSIG
jgi:predicted signal transduction protein with EAL and GGDEF domain